MNTRLLAVAVMVGLFGAPVGAGEFDIPLRVTESAGVARTDEPVSGGVPFPRGVLKDPGQVTLTDADGKEVPAQFSAINRRAHDNSIMWLLVQGQATVPAKGTATFHLRSGKPTAAPRGFLKVSDAADAVTVETGAIKFVVSKKRFNLIDAAWITAGGRETPVIAPGGAGGSRLRLAANAEVYSSIAEPPTEVTVEESGPLRATILVRGLHRPAGGKGKLPYLYGYQARIRAYAGQPVVRISYTLTSGHLPAIGSPLCKSAAISVELAIGAAKSASHEGGLSVFDGKVLADLSVRYLKENAPAKVKVIDDSIVLRPWGEQEDFLDICSRKTYEMQLALLPAGQGDVAARGDELFKAFDSALRFWCPPQWTDSTAAWGDFGAVAVPDGPMKTRIERQFRPYRLAGWRDFGSDPEFESGSSRAPGGGYEPLLKTAHFYLGYLQTGDRRYFDQSERTSWHWRDRRYIYLDGDWSAKSWTGHGGVYWAYYSKGGKAYPAVQPGNYRRYDGSWNYGGRYGPMDTQHFSVDEVVNYYYLTGDRLCLDALDMYGQQAMSFISRVTQSKGGKVSRAHGWVTRALVSVYEATNDTRYLKAARDAVRYILDHQDKRAGTISPVDEVIDRGRDKGKPVRHTPFMAAAVGMALGRYYRHYPEEETRDAILGLADWLYYDVAKPAGGFSYAWYVNNPGGRSGSGHRCMSTMGWAYLATGKKQYMEAADLHAGFKEGLDPRQVARIAAQWQVNGFGQEYMTLRNAKRVDAAAPAAVADLKAEPLGGGKVRLTWTAPGDDGSRGRADEYQVKYAKMEITERSDWRKKPDSEISFWAATNCKGEPGPAQAGAKETFTVEGLASGTWWFSLKSYDEQPNQSDLSNVLKVEVK